MIIAVSGTPGTGKTTLSKRLAKKLNHKYLDIAKLIKEKRLQEAYDKKRECYIIDVKKLNKELIKIIKNSKSLVIDSHLSHYLPKKYIDLCIITKCSLKTLKKRLEKKHYKKEKIRENLDCEIFDICLNEAKEAGHKILIVDTTKGININKIVKEIKK